MNPSTSPQRGALVLVFVGIVLALAGSVLVFLTGETTWRYLTAVGGSLQLIGWVLHIRGRRGGAR